MLICIACGFTSGLPLYILYQLIPAWLRDQGIDRTTIGLFSLVGFPYTWKFIWSALMDVPLPGPLGRRRSWALLCQICLMVTLAALALFDPKTSLNEIVWVVALVAFFSASQDIVLDAYRRELLPDHELGIGNSYYVNAYRLSSLVPGSLALILADRLPWSTVHLIVAAFMLVGILTTLMMPEQSAPTVSNPSSKPGIERLWEPLAEFFVSRGTRQAVLLLVFMLLYKLGDSMATALATPFYLDMGFSKTEIGTIAKTASLWSSITGGVVGGVLMIKIGINRAL
ncbi:MAG TPA: AmpG family muropeptide MFS transporter, partial [Myxococcales bacterium]|nr:AmpG family muropeptide MFS transporter [Myxococcales bacterium]HAN32036.1 AmpG family muropeptide MFS transporter [Myxococcales bacterium]